MGATKKSSSYWKDFRLGVLQKKIDKELKREEIIEIAVRLAVNSEFLEFYQ